MAEFFSGLFTLGATGVGIAEFITALNPASWWASGILGIIEAGLIGVLAALGVTL